MTFSRANVDVMPLVTGAGRATSSTGRPRSSTRGLAGATRGPSPSTRARACAQVLQKLGYITEYRWAFGLDDLILAVGYAGPAVLGLNWYEGMFDVSPCGHVHVSGELSGGHAILCNGVNVKEGYFNLHNSWGKSWGRGGDARITFEEMDKLLRENGEAVVPMFRKLL